MRSILRALAVPLSRLLSVSFLDRIGGSIGVGGGGSGNPGPIDDAPAQGYVVWSSGMLAGAVPEVTAVGTTLGQVIGVPGQNIQYTLIYDEDDKFSIGTSTGYLTLRNPLNYAVKSSHTFTVMISTVAGFILLTRTVSVTDRAPETIDLTWEPSFPGGFVPEATAFDGSVKLFTVSAYPGTGLTISVTDTDNKINLVDNGDGTADGYLDGQLSASTNASHPFTITVSNAFGSVSRSDYLVVNTDTGVNGINFLPMSFQFASQAGFIMGKFELTFGAGPGSSGTFTPATFQRTELDVGVVMGEYI